MNNGPELVDSLDGVTYILTAPRAQVTWQVPRGANIVVERKRLRRGDKITQVPEYNLARLVQLGHAVPEDEYDPEKLAAEKMRKRLIYDQGAASTAMLEFQMEMNRRAAKAGGGVAGLDEAPTPDTDPALTDTGREVDGIKLEDVDARADAPADDDDELTSTEAGNEGESGEDIPDYRSMDYPALQRLAKDTTGSGAGGKDELIARLDEHYGKSE